MNLFVSRSMTALAGLWIMCGATCQPALASKILPVQPPPYPRGVAVMDKLSTSCGGAAIAKLISVPGLDHRAISLRSEQGYAAAIIDFPSFYLSPVTFENMSVTYRGKCSTATEGLAIDIVYRTPQNDLLTAAFLCGASNTDVMERDGVVTLKSSGDSGIPAGSAIRNFSVILFSPANGNELSATVLDIKLNGRRIKSATVVPSSECN